MSASSGFRVAIDARSRTGTTGGVQQFTLGLLHSLGRLPDEGDEYLALTFADDAAWLAPAVSRRVHLLSARLPATRRGLLGSLRRRALTQFPFVRSGWTRLRRSLPTGEELARSDGTVERVGVDVMHFVRQMAFLTEIPSIYHPWDLQHIHLPQFFTDRERRIRDNAYQSFCARAARIVAATSWTKADLVKTYGIAAERIMVIPVAQDPDGYPVPSSEDIAEVRKVFDLPERFLIYPAQTWPHKNHLLLLEALARTGGVHHETINLVCTGHLNEHYAEIKRAVDRHHLGDRVRFLGYVTAAQLQAIYRCSTGMIFPSLFEGWGIPIVEAFMAGTPVACSSATSLPALVRDAALVFDPNDVGQIVEAALSLWTDPDLREVLVVRGRQRAGEFNPLQVARTYRALYRDVAGRTLDEGDRAALAAPPLV